MTDLSKVDPDQFVPFQSNDGTIQFMMLMLISSYNNDENVLKKKLKISKKNLRGVEFDESGSSLLTISKDKTFRILDTETWAVK